MTLPDHLKIRDTRGKWILRQVLYKYVSESLLECPKAGFAIPLDASLPGPLRDWAETLLDESRLRNEGFIDPAPIRKKWRTSRRSKKLAISDLRCADVPGLVGSQPKVGAPLHSEWNANHGP